jgi:5-methylcytosine-specific restriction endonuclease McrA
MNETTQLKTCCTCKEAKPLDSFALYRARPDGRQIRCRTCTSLWYKDNRDRVLARVAEYKANNPQVVAERQRDYRRRNPEKVKQQARAAYLARADYYRAKTRAARDADPTAHRERNNEWALANPDRVRAIKSRYKHKRRALQDASPYRVTGRDLKRAYQLAEGTCTYCGRKFESIRSATWDHVVPVSRGGSFGIGNLVPACQSCNSSKQDKTITEWRAWQRGRLAA